MRLVFFLPSCINLFNDIFLFLGAQSFKWMQEHGIEVKGLSRVIISYVNSQGFLIDFIRGGLSGIFPKDIRLLRFPQYIVTVTIK